MSHCSWRRLWGVVRSSLAGLGGSCGGGAAAPTPAAPAGGAHGGGHGAAADLGRDSAGARDDAHDAGAGVTPAQHQRLPKHHKLQALHCGRAEVTRTASVEVDVRDRN